MDIPFEGVVAALMTPMDRDGVILASELRDEAAFLTESGVDGLCIGGPLGELSGASTAEVEAVCSAARSESDLPIAVNLFVDLTAEAIDSARAAEASGAAAVLISQPHYLFQPGESGLIRQFSDIRNVVGIPLLLSNTVPSALVPASTVRKLYERSLIDGVYQGTDPHALADVLCATPRMPVFAGIEDLLYVGLALGARGIISTLAAIFPHECLAMRFAVAEDDHETARLIHARLLKVWRKLDHPSESFARSKHALSVRGRPVGFARHPYQYLSPESATDVEQGIAEFTEAASS
ncbi:MAG: dihydrodipicolinate synthase family protein [Bryobacterales bacterium]|nr:dihydrodipicolinate synthase family protein [Bryobacterales bacterium]MEB2362475.1 dihydrodipicolinate synthase family protein [Bryobacterales bacterium]